MQRMAEKPVRATSPTSAPTDSTFSGEDIRRQPGAGGEGGAPEGEAQRVAQKLAAFAKVGSWLGR